MPSLFPDNLYTTHKWCSRIPFTLTQGVLMTASFSMNNLNLPFIGLASSQPMGFDQFSDLYLRFIVYTSKIQLRFMTDNDFALEAYIAPDSDSTSLPATIGQAEELPYVKTKAINSRAAPVSYMSHKCSVKVLEGRRIGSEDGYSGGVQPAAAPILEKWWNVGLIAPLANTFVELRVTIWYKTRWFNRRMTLTPS